MAEQGPHRRAAESAESLQLRPPALDQVLLQVFGVREGRVEEDQQVVSQDGAAHVAAVRAAVAGDALVQSVGGFGHSAEYFENISETQKLAS